MRIHFDPPPEDGPWHMTGRMEWPFAGSLDEGRPPLCEWINDNHVKVLEPGYYVNMPIEREQNKGGGEDWLICRVRQFLAWVLRPNPRF